MPNAGGYGKCAPGCKLGPRCGDGEVQAEECAAGCKLGPRCGDGVVQPELEQRDDGNVTSGDGCSSTCKKEGPK